MVVAKQRKKTLVNGGVWLRSGGNLRKSVDARGTFRGFQCTAPRLMSR